MTTQEILFQRQEYREVDEGVKILVQTIVEKLPKKARKTQQDLHWDQQKLQKQADLIKAGVDPSFLGAWLHLNAADTQKGERAPRIVYALLIEIMQLTERYGADAVTLALTKVCGMDAPQKATVPYLKSILRNGIGGTPVERSRPPVERSRPPVERSQNADDAWAQVQMYLRERISPPNYNTWIHPCRVKEISKNGLTILCPDETFQAWLREHYTRILSAAFGQIYGSMPDHLIIEVAR